MDTATLTPDAPSTAAAPAPGEQRRERRWRPRRPEPGRTDWVYPAALGALLLASLLIRLWGVKQGLPYSYNSDEATHFVPRAVGFLSQDLNPHYFLNPPAYSYLLYIVFELWFGSADAIRSAFTSDPTSVFVVARVVAAVLGTVAVWLTYLAGKRLFDRAVGLLAGAVMAFAFLPVFYSHLALNDVPTLAPVALSLYGVAGVLRFGRRRDYAIAGIGIGLAAATKYTGGITLVCLLAAALCDGLDGSGRSAARRCALALGLALLAFVAANPYAALDPNEFFSGVSQQASQTAGPFKLGSNPGSGIEYYLWTFTWGLGWVPTLATLGGAALLLVRRRLALALVLLPAPLAFIVFMGNQQRFFGRWLMPIFPIVALLGAYGAVELARALSRSRGPAPARRLMPAALAGALVAVAMLGQSVAADVHNDAGALAPGHAQPRPDLDGEEHPGRVEGGDRAARARQLGPRRRQGDPGHANRRTLVALPHVADQPRPEPQPTAGRPAPVRVRRSVRALPVPAAARSVRRPGLLLGRDRLTPGRPRVRPARRRSPGRLVLLLALPAREARLPGQPLRPRRPPGPLQLRLVDRLLPGPVPAPGAGDRDLPPDRREVHRLAPLLTVDALTSANKVTIQRPVNRPNRLCSDRNDRQPRSISSTWPARLSWPSRDAAA